jgi:hypothetical protein
MARHFIERTRLCGWEENEDLRLRALVVGLVEILRLDVRRRRHTGEVTIKPMKEANNG